MITYQPYQPWTVYQAESGRWIGTNGRARVFLVRDSREGAQQALDERRRYLAAYPDIIRGRSVQP